MNELNGFKVQYLQHMANLDSFRNAWPTWSPEINKLIRAAPNIEIGIYELGDRLGDIFRGTGQPGRDQKVLSGAGAAWESLVCWYLNLVGWNTPIIFVRANRHFVPETIYNGISVNIANFQSNTESDLLAFTVPRHDELAEGALRRIEEHVGAGVSDVSLGIIQCKTNWNDNAQIPMLWNMVYDSKAFTNPHVSVGKGGITPKTFKNFHYSFVTVPTSRGPFKVNSTAVQRVRGLSGKNYWGRPSEDGVAFSIKQYFDNFSALFPGGVKNHIKANCEKDPEFLNNFIQSNYGQLVQPLLL